MSIFQLPNFVPVFNLLQLNMDVITIESQAFKELTAKINTIAKFIVNLETEEKNPDNEWVDSYEVCTFLKISERTLQRLRSNGIIAYTKLSGKTYYTIGEIKRMLSDKRICSTDECLMNLIQNHKLHAEQRRNTKPDK